MCIERHLVDASYSHRDNKIAAHDLDTDWNVHCNAALGPGRALEAFESVLFEMQERSSNMNRIVTTVTAGALAAAFAIAPAVAQNLPPPGNVNPGSMNSGAEETGAENQPRSYGPYYNAAPGAYYGSGYDAYASDGYGQPSMSYGQPGMSYGPFGYAPGYGPYGLGTGGAGAIGSNN